MATTLEATATPLQVTLKVASRCNLNCSYCYVYNKGDDSWRSRPAIMHEEVFEAAVARIQRHARASGQDRVEVVFHGGEPLLVGRERFDRWCRRLREEVGGVCRLGLTLQTNGTLLDDEWAALLGSHGVQVGLSLDGPAQIHDAFRVDHRGRPTYDRIVTAVDALRRNRLRLNVLCVIQFGHDPVEIHRHLVGLGASSIAYLMPDHTHETVPRVHKRFGPTPCADFLIPIFEEWWANGDLSVTVNPFNAFARAILGGASRVDFIGNRPFGFIFIETDGAIEGLDVLRICGARLSSTGLNVLEHDLEDAREASELHRRSIFTGFELPTACRDCPESETCAGGYLPHRFSRAADFDNPTVWCADHLALFEHLRRRLDVSIEETGLRQQVLAEMAAEPPPALTRSEQ
jgi:uncharacterized protein